MNPPCVARLLQTPVMGSIKQWLLFAALFSLSVTNVAYSQDDTEGLVQEDVDIPDKAFLLVRHKIDTVELVQGKNTSVVVEIHNAGNRYNDDLRPANPWAVLTHRLQGLLRP